MSSRDAHTHRRARQRRARMHRLVIGGSLLLLVGAAIVLLVIGASPSMSLVTQNVKGTTSAPVEVEEWSDFQ